MNDYNHPQNVKIIVRLRGEGQDHQSKLFTIQAERPSKSSKSPVRPTNLSSQVRQRSRSPTAKTTSPVIKGTQGLDENTKYTIFTSLTPSNTLVVSNKPISGKTINSTFRTTNDLYEFTHSIMKDSVLLEFDRVYNESHKLDTIYNEQLKENVNNLFLGKSACCVLFGPSDSGKSFTLRGGLEGKTNDCGILGRSINDIFNLVDLSKQANIGKGNQGGTYYAIKMSVYQVYLDQINDLLTSQYNRNIKVEKYFDNENNLNTHLIDMTEKEVKSKKEYDNYIREAMHNRKCLAQALKVNEAKRKSHLVISIMLERRERMKENLHKTNEKSIDKFAQIDFVELASSQYGLPARNSRTKPDNEQEANTLLFKNTSKTFNSLCNNIVNASAGMTPKYESKLTLALKSTIRPNNQIIFISCALPWEEYFLSSYKSLKFTNWLRNQCYNIHANQDYRIKSTYEDSEEEEYPRNSKKFPEGSTYETEPKRRNKEYSEDDQVNMRRDDHYVSRSEEDQQGGYSSAEEQEIRRMREDAKMNRRYHIRTSDNEDEVKNKSLRIINTSYADRRGHNSNPSDKEDNYTKEKKLKEVEQTLRELEAKSLEMSKYLENFKHERSRLDDTKTIGYGMKSVTLELENDKIKQEYATLKSDNIIFREDINRLSEVNRHLEDELQRQRNRNFELAAENERLCQERNQIRMEMDKMNESLSKAKLHEHNVMEQFNQRFIYENKLRDNEVELRTLRDEKQKFEVELKVLQERHAELKRTHEATEGELNFIKIKQADEVNKIEEKLDKMAKEMEFLQRENVALRQNEDRMRHDLHNMEKQRDEYRDKYQEHKQKNNLLNVKLNEIEDEFKRIMYEKENEHHERRREEELKRMKIDSKQKIVGELQSRIYNYRNELLRQRNKKEEA